MSDALGTVANVRGGGVGPSRWRRPLIAGLLALLVLLLLLLLVERAGGHVRDSDTYAAVAIAILVGAMLA